MKSGVRSVNILANARNQQKEDEVRPLRYLATHYMIFIRAVSTACVHFDYLEFS